MSSSPARARFSSVFHQFAPGGDWKRDLDESAVTRRVKKIYSNPSYNQQVPAGVSPKKKRVQNWGKSTSRSSPMVMTCVDKNGKSLLVVFWLNPNS